MQILRGHGSGKVVWGLAFSPDGSKLASSALDRTVRLWDLATGANEILSTDCTSSYLSFSPAGDRLLYGSWRQVHVHDLNSRQSRGVAVPQEYYRPTWGAFDPSGREILVALARLRRYDAQTLGPLSDWEQCTHLQPCLAFTRDGRTLATAHFETRPTGRRRYDYPVRLWDYPQGTLAASLHDPPKEVTALAFSPGGRTLAAACGPTLLVWEVTSRRVALAEKPDKHHFQDVAFSPDGRWLGAAHNDNSVRLYSTLSWKAEHAFDWTIGSIVRVCFAPDGMRAAAAGKTGCIVVWDMDL